MAVVPYVRATHSDGLAWSAAKANLLEAGVNDVSFAPAVRVFHNTTQSFTSGVEASVAFNSERFDQAGNAADTMHDNASNNSRLTCRYAGVYLIGTTITWASAPTNSGVAIRHQGSTRIAYVENSGATANVNTVYALAVNEYVEVRAIQTSGGPINISSSASQTPEFWMVRIG